VTKSHTDGVFGVRGNRRERLVHLFKAVDGRVEVKNGALANKVGVTGTCRVNEADRI
jgi:hypothetical protein